jgi:tRNA dimethylallyltransferase
MLGLGLINEVKGLLDKYPEKTIKALDSVGYKETVQFIRGEITREALPGAIERNTLLLAKRQATWFKREKNITWYDPDEMGMAQVLKRAQTLTRDGKNQILP